MRCDRRGNRIDVRQRFLRRRRISDLQSVIFFQRHNELQSVNRIKPKPTGPEKRQIIRNFFRLLLQHQIFDEQLFYFVFQLVGVVHAVA